MYERGRARACGVASHDSLPYNRHIFSNLVFVLVSTE
jgi:hypothetical protein